MKNFFSRKFSKNIKKFNEINDFSLKNFEIFFWDFFHFQKKINEKKSGEKSWDITSM